MSTYTDNFGLGKPDINDAYDINVYNANMDTIDTELGGIKDKMNGQELKKPTFLGSTIGAQTKEIFIDDTPNTRLMIPLNTIMICRLYSVCTAPGFRASFQAVIELTNKNGDTSINGIATPGVYAHSSVIGSSGAITDEKVDLAVTTLHDGLIVYVSGSAGNTFSWEVDCEIVLQKSL